MFTTYKTPPIPHIFHWKKIGHKPPWESCHHPWQVLFTDLDLDVNELGGNVSWEQPALDTSLITHYLVGMGGGLEGLENLKNNGIYMMDNPLILLGLSGYMRFWVLCWV